MPLKSYCKLNIELNGNFNELIAQVYQLDYPQLGTDTVHQTVQKTMEMAQWQSG